MKVKSICATPGVDKAMKEVTMFASFVRDCLDRFFSGDYGDICEEDDVLNTRARLMGERILASYDSDMVPEKRVWICAEAEDDFGERHMTILFPSEY